jgi:1-acyl-sn-glycerol-3-phosphate acyltransferase
VINRWFRPEVRGLATFPSVGGALLVSNHSGGVLTPDWNVLAPALYREFGYDRRCTPSPTMACSSHRFAHR